MMRVALNLQILLYRVILYVLMSDVTRRSNPLVISQGSIHKSDLLNFEGHILGTGHVSEVPDYSLDDAIDGLGFMVSDLAVVEDFYIVRFIFEDFHKNG